MTTRLGKELRKIRLDLGITMFEMAQQIGISSAMLSSVETGKKPASAGMITRLCDEYPVIQQRRQEFERLADATKAEVRIRLDSANTKANDVALAFARNFDSLSAEQLDKLMIVFNRAAGKGQK